MRSHSWVEWLNRTFGRRPAGNAGSNRRRPRHFLPRLEALESRLAPASVTVSTVNDVVDGDTTNITNLIANPGPDGKISLREALEAADNTASTALNPNIINVPAGTYDLIHGQLTIGSATDPYIQIVGSGTAANTVIQHDTSTGSARVLQVDPAAAGGVNLTISNVSIQDGVAPGGQGGGGIQGGIASGTDNLSLSNVYIYGNMASAAGGGVSWQGGQLSMTGAAGATVTSYVSGNTTSGNGGGIAFISTAAGDSATIQNTEVVDNRASGGNGGGGLYITGPGATGLTADSFIGNTTTGANSGGGGAIFENGGSLTVTTTSFANNTASGTGEAAGAIYVNNGSANITYSRFADNAGSTAAQGNTLFRNTSNATSATANEDWWGNNAGPGANDFLKGPAGTTSGAIVTPADYLMLEITSTSTSVNAGGSASVTADFFKDSVGNTITVAELLALNGVPIGFTATDGTISAAQATIQSGEATATYNAGTPGTGSVTAQVDNPPGATIQFPIIASAALNITNTDNQSPDAVPGTSITYTLVVTNATGPNNANGATVVDTFPATLSNISYTATGSGGASGFTAAGMGSIDDTVNLPVGSKITYKVTAFISSAASGALANTATVTVPPGTNNPNGTNGTVTATDTDTLTPRADLKITNTDGKTTISPGLPDTYTLTVSNSGPSDITGASVADTLPAVFTGVTYTATETGGASGFTASGSGNSINDSVNVPAGSTITYTVTGTLANSATGTVTNTAKVTKPIGSTDTNTSNNTATDTDTVGKSADLSITNTDNQTTAVPGGVVTYTIVVNNAGPSTATGAVVTDSFPTNEFGSVTYTATQSGGASGFTASGSGNIRDTVNMPLGSSITYVAVANVSSSATNLLSDAAQVSPPSDTADFDMNNNIASDTDTLTPQADLAVTLTDGKTSAVSGAVNVYTLVVINNGPSDVTGAVVSDAFPSTFTGVTYTATQTGGASNFTANGNGPINDSVRLPRGSHLTYIVTGTIDPAATGTFTVSAVVTTPTGTTETNSSNNSASDTDSLTVQADLQITQTDGQTNAVPNSPDTYTIVVTNAGPSNVAGASVADSFPGVFTGVTYTAAETGGATGATGGVGNISQTLNLPVGSSVTYMAKGTVSAASGTISNTATVTKPGNVTDPNLSNNSATDTDTIGYPVDLSVTVTDNLHPAAVPGSPITYTIVVSNTGPDNAGGATVYDAFPPQLEGVTYTATTTSGATGFTPSGSGRILDTVFLPAGGQIVYTVQATVDPNATGTLSDTASVAVAPSGTTDVNPINNSYTDADTLGPLTGMIAVHGAAGANTLTVTATDTDAGTYSLNGGPSIPFVAATGLYFTGGSGDNTLVINNPAGSLFAPAGGVNFVGGGGTNSLDVYGGAHTGEVHTFAPNGLDGQHNGAIAFINGGIVAQYSYFNLSPILIYAGTPSDIVFNLPGDNRNDQAILQEAGTPTDGLSEITSGDGAFETTTFVNPSNSLTVNVTGPVAQTMTLAPLDSRFVAPTITFNGGPLGDVFNIQATPANTSVAVNGGSGDGLNFNAAGAAIGTVPGAFTTDGRVTLTHSAVGALFIDNAAAVNSSTGPDTADRSTAFIGLNPQERFVQALYLDVLHRAGGRAELDSWVGLLNSSGSQAVVANAIEHTQEARTQLVVSWYAAYLGRTPVNGEEQVWVKQLMQGQTENQVLSQILSGAEFYSRAQTLVSSGTANERYVQSLYLLLFNRSASAGEVEGWVSVLPQLGLQGVAASFLTGSEFRTDLFEGYYDVLLHRASDPASLSGWVYSSDDPSAVRVAFESSSEFFYNG